MMLDFEIHNTPAAYNTVIKCAAVTLAGFSLMILNAKRLVIRRLTPDETLTIRFGTLHKGCNISE